MASQIIGEAISVGAPAYNAGDIALCVEIYQVAAQQLLSSHAGELSPKISRELEAALGAAAAARGGGSDRLAWAFRRAFDAQLQLGAAPSSATAARPGRSVAEVVAAAVAEGAPTYNRGDHAGCARLYAETARTLIQSGGLDEAVRAQLQAALRENDATRDATKGAWALRRALDAAAAGDEGRGVARAARPRSDGLIQDFARGEGIGLQPSTVNDTVMGGRSSSRAVPESGGLIFEGDVTKRGGGGFASVRFAAPRGESLGAALRGKTGITFAVSSVRGCKAWKLQLHEGYDATTWQADFVASTNSGGVQRIPFSAFMPTWRGMPQGSQGLTSNALEKIRSIGFMVSFLAADGRGETRFEEGPFALKIVRIEAY